MDSAHYLIHVPAGIPRSLVTDYVTRCRQNLHAEQEALHTPDYERLRVFGHRIKGTGAAYGIPLLTQMGASIEQAARERNLDQVQSQMTAMRAYLDSLQVAE